jgi:small subunit ribosomal protein S2
MGELLISEDRYVSCGVQIGTKQKNADMKEFISYVRNDGLYIIDIKKSDYRIKESAKFLARYDPSTILIVSARQYGQKPVNQLATTIGAVAIPGRFMPGTLTNPNAEQFIEPDVLVVTDPIGDFQALKEAVIIGIPIVGLCDTNNRTKYIDLVIPANNKGRRSLALVYWLLAREILIARKKIEKREDFEMAVEDFEAEL